MAQWQQVQSRVAAPDFSNAARMMDFSSLTGTIDKIMARRYQEDQDKIKQDQWNRTHAIAREAADREEFLHLQARGDRENRIKAMGELYNIAKEYNSMPEKQQAEIAQTDPNLVNSIMAFNKEQSKAQQEQQIMKVPYTYEEQGPKQLVGHNVPNISMAMPADSVIDKHKTMIPKPTSARNARISALNKEIKQDKKRKSELEAERDSIMAPYTVGFKAKEDTKMSYGNLDFSKTYDASGKDVTSVEGLTSQEQFIKDKSTGKLVSLDYASRLATIVGKKTTPKYADGIMQTKTGYKTVKVDIPTYSTKGNPSMSKEVLSAQGVSVGQAEEFTGTVSQAVQNLFEQYMPKDNSKERANLRNEAGRIMSEFKLDPQQFNLLDHVDKIMPENKMSDDTKAYITTTLDALKTDIDITFKKKDLAFKEKQLAINTMLTKAGHALQAAKIGTMNKQTQTLEEIAAGKGAVKAMEAKGTFYGKLSDPSEVSKLFNSLVENNMKNVKNSKNFWDSLTTLDSTMYEQAVKQARNQIGNMLDPEMLESLGTSLYANDGTKIFPNK